MRRLLFITALSIASVRAQVPTQDAPANKILRAWLEAFNSGRRANMEAFLQTYAHNYQPNSGTDAMIKFHDTTGNLELLGIENVTPAGAQAPISLFTKSLVTTDRRQWTHIEFRVKQQANSKTAVGELDRTDTQPAQIVNLNFVGLANISLRF